MYDRPAVTLPPKGWRKPIPARIKRAVLKRQRNLDANTGDPLVKGHYQFDHRPPLHEREYILELDDTHPAANHPGFIFAINTGDHRKISGRDNVRMKKTNRLRGNEASFRSAVASKGEVEAVSVKFKNGFRDKVTVHRKMQSRPFPPKGSRPMGRKQ